MGHTLEQMHDPFVTMTQQPPSYNTKAQSEKRKITKQKRKVRENSSGFKHNSIENLSLIGSISGLMTCGFFGLHFSRIEHTYKVGKWIKYSFNSTLVLKEM